MIPEKERKTKMAFERIQYHPLRQNLMKGIQKYFFYRLKRILKIRAGINVIISEELLERCI